MGRFGIWEVVIILGVVLLLFGAKKLPEIARSMGNAIKEFKKAGKEIEGEIKEVADDSDNGKKA